MKRVTVEKTVRFTLTVEEIRKRLRVPGGAMLIANCEAGVIGALNELSVTYTTPVKPRGEKAE